MGARSLLSSSLSPVYDLVPPVEEYRPHRRTFAILSAVEGPLFCFARAPRSHHDHGGDDVANVRQDEKGRWWVDFRWHTTRIRRHLDEDGCPLSSREHAVRTHRALLHKLETGQPIAAPRRGKASRASSLVEMITHPYSVGEACLVYVDLSARKNSFFEIERSCRMWIRLLGEKPIDELTSLDVEMAMEKRASETSNSSANRDLTYLRAALRKAVHAGKARRDPTEGIAKLPEPPHRRRWLRQAEGEELWRHLTDPQDRRLVLFIVNTGLRRGNACATEWSWVDFENGSVDIPRTKSGEALHVPLNSVALAVLREQHRQTGHSRWVWLGARGAPLNARNWWKRHFRPALVAAGLISAEDRESGRMPSFRTHDLRHTFGSRATAAGVHLQATQEILGHSSVKVTERYSHIDSGQLRAAAEAMAWQPDATLSMMLRGGSGWPVEHWTADGRMN